MNDTISQEAAIKAINNDPEFALAFIVGNNLDDVYANLIKENVYADKTEAEVNQAIARLLNKGQKAKALRILNVEFIPENVPIEYFPVVEASTTIDFPADDDAPLISGTISKDYTGSGYNPNDVTNGGNTGGTGGNTGGNTGGSAGNWLNGLFNMASTIVVGLWGNQALNDPRNPNSPYYRKDNTGIFVVVGLVIAAVVLIVVLKK
jgi:hypothetical protein